LEDNGEKKKSHLKSIGLIVLLGTALGVLLAFLDVDLSFMDNIGLLEIPLVLLLFYMGVFLVINIHELGHLIFGKFLGYRFLMFRAGIFSIHKENGKLRFSIIRNVGYGGLCAMIPSEDSDLKDFAVYSTGGIIFNLITGILFLFLPEILSLRLIFAVPLYGTGMVSILLALINAWPFFSMNQPTDGMMFISILKKNPLAERFYESVILSKKLMTGVRPRDLELKEPKLPLEDQHETSNVLYLYFMALDGGDEELARKYIQIIEENLSKVPPYALPAFYYEIIFFNLLTGDNEKAVRYYEKAGKILEKDRDINGLRIKAYYAHYVERDNEKARRLAEEGMGVMEKYPFRGQAIFEEDQLQKLIRRIEITGE